jgi:hypothetical protein
MTVAANAVAVVESTKGLNLERSVVCLTEFVGRCGSIHISGVEPLNLMFRRFMLSFTTLHFFLFHQPKNWLSLTKAATKSVLVDTQDESSSVAVPFHSIIGPGIKQEDYPNETTYVTVDLDDSDGNIVVAIKDMRRPTAKNDKDPTMVAANDVPFELCLARRVDLEDVNSRDGSRDTNDHNYNNTQPLEASSGIWANYQILEALPRRQLRILRPGDRLCTRARSHDSSDEDEPFWGVGLILEYRLQNPAPDTNSVITQEGEENQVSKSLRKQLEEDLVASAATQEGGEDASDDDEALTQAPPQPTPSLQIIQSGDSDENSTNNDRKVDDAQDSVVLELGTQHVGEEDKQNGDDDSSLVGKDKDNEGSDDGKKSENIKSDNNKSNEQPVSAPKHQEEVSMEDASKSCSASKPYIKKEKPNEVNVSGNKREKTPPSPVGDEMLSESSKKDNPAAETRKPPDKHGDRDAENEARADELEMDVDNNEVPKQNGVTNESSMLENDFEAAKGDATEDSKQVADDDDDDTTASLVHTADDNKSEVESVQSLQEPKSIEEDGKGGSDHRDNHGVEANHCDISAEIGTVKQEVVLVESTTLSASNADDARDSKVDPNNLYNKPPNDTKQVVPEVNAEKSQPIDAGDMASTAAKTNESKWPPLDMILNTESEEVKKKEGEETNAKVNGTTRSTDSHNGDNDMLLPSQDSIGSPNRRQCKSYGTRSRDSRVNLLDEEETPKPTATKTTGRSKRQLDDEAGVEDDDRAHEIHLLPKLEEGEEMVLVQDNASCHDLLEGNKKTAKSESSAKRRKKQLTSKSSGTTTRVKMGQSVSNYNSEESQEIDAVVMEEQSKALLTTAPPSPERAATASDPTESGRRRRASKGTQSNEGLAASTVSPFATRETEQKQQEEKQGESKETLTPEHEGQQPQEKQDDDSVTSSAKTGDSKPAHEVAVEQALVKSTLKSKQAKPQKQGFASSDATTQARSTRKRRPTKADSKKAQTNDPAAAETKAPVKENARQGKTTTPASEEHEDADNAVHSDTKATTKSSARKRKSIKADVEKPRVKNDDLASPDIRAPARGTRGSTTTTKNNNKKSTEEPESDAAKATTRTPKTARTRKGVAANVEDRPYKRAKDDACPEDVIRIMTTNVTLTKAHHQVSADVEIPR